jgi:hypothetical protein
MRRAAVLLAIVSLVLAATSDARTARSFTIRVYVTEVTQSIKDVPPKTLGVFEYTRGDTIRGTETLRNAVRQFGKPKGTDVGSDRYVITAVAYQRIRVDFVTNFPGGTVHSHGVGKPGAGKVPIVGGTGLYAGATGVAEGRHLANGLKLNIYRLRAP